MAAEKPASDTTVEGGRYIVDGVTVDAQGKPISGSGSASKPPRGGEAG